MPYFDRRPTLAVRLSRLQENVTIARERRKQFRDDWTQTYNFYRSEPDTAWDPEGYRLQVNFPFAWYESMMPSLVHSNPKFRAEPLGPESEDSAPTVEAAITNELRVTGFKRNLKRATFDALLYGVGLVQLGYYDQGLIPKNSGVQPDTPDNITQAGPKSSSDLPYGINPGQIYTLPIRPWNFLVDPTATTLDDALWCGVEYVRDLEAIKKDPQYEHTENLDSDEFDMPFGMSIDDFRNKFEREPERNMVRLIQYWDIVDRKVYVFTKGHDQFLGTFPFRVPVKRFPFYPIHATDDNETFWNQSPMIPWLNLVSEYNLTISARLSHLSRFKRKYAYDKNRVNEEDVEALMHPQDGTLVAVDGQGGDVGGAISPIQDANISPDSYAFTGEIRQRWTEIAGMSEFDLGGSRPGERPAAEINRIAGAANARRQSLAGRVQSMLENLAGDVRAVMEEFYTKERVVKLTGDRGETIWAKYDGSELSGEYLFHCRIEDMAAKSPEDRLQRAAQTLQVLTPYSQAGSPAPIIDIRPQLREVARELGTDELRFLPEQAPLMDPGQELFLMLRKGVELLPNAEDDHEWHIFVHDKQLRDDETIRSPSTVERLRNHVESHRAQLRALQASLEGQQAVQQQRQAGGSPGPGAGQTNNPSGGAGIFATGGGQTPQGASGGATGQNIQEVLRGGF